MDKCPSNPAKGTEGAKRKRHWGRKIFLTILAVYLAWLGWEFAGYKRYVSENPPSPPFRKGGETSYPPSIGKSPLPPFSKGGETSESLDKEEALQTPREEKSPRTPLYERGGTAAVLGKESQPSADGYEVRGAYHMHSKFSDGRKSVDAIARTAARAGLDFVILTDHGAPNTASLAAQGRIHGVHVLAGTEISTSRGHLVALAFAPPNGPFAQNADNAFHQIRTLGGLAVVAHPYSKTKWSWGGTGKPDGIEIMDSDSMLKRNWPRALVRLPHLAVKPQIPLLRIITRPEDSLRKWDQLLTGGPVRGFFSTDAHFLYGPAFAIFRIVAILDAPLPEEFEAARTAIFEALRAGRFYCAIDAAADPTGFRFRDEPGNGRLRASTPFSFKHETRLIHAGQTVATSVGADCVFEPLEPGVYRAEVYLRERSPLAGDVPWIISNPISITPSDKDLK